MSANQLIPTRAEVRITCADGTVYEVVLVRQSDHEMRVDLNWEIAEQPLPGPAESLIMQDKIGSVSIHGIVAQLVRHREAPVCTCELKDVSVPPGIGKPEFVRGRPDGCPVHGVERDAAVAAARDEARRRP